MKRTLGLILAAVLLGGCSPSSQIVDVTDVQYEPAGPTPQAEALPTPSPTPGPYVTEDIFVVECEDGINLRESSSSKSDLIGTPIAWRPGQSAGLSKPAVWPGYSWTTARSGMPLPAI